MASRADLMQLTKEQLVTLIVERGNTIDSLNQARHLLLKLFNEDVLSSEHLFGYLEETAETIVELAVAEEKILAGQSPTAKPN